ncbi:hypothetical protein V2J09_011676 [Rumex salicifolius]
MKIWCDVCSKKEASVFCSADEAALCEDCDSRVHQANKLASKHQRFSLLQPSNSSHLPHCDICQEKKALLFCQQDRAILCRDCDVSLHTANELTHKHDRFLLTGAKLSLLPSISKTKNLAKRDLTNSGFDLVPDFRSNTQIDLIPQATDNVTVTQQVIKNQLSYVENGSTSSISEYLMEMLPGWQVEDLLNSSSSDPIGFPKACGDDELLFKNAHFESRVNCYDHDDYHNNNNGLWVPQAPIMPSPFNPGFCVLKNGAEVAKGDVLGRKASKYLMDDGFTVPQISPQSPET